MNQESPALQGPGVELRQILHVFAKWRAVMAVVVVAAVGTSGVISFFVLPKVYRATATVNISNAVSSQQQASAQPGAAQQTSLEGVVNAASTLPLTTLQTYQWEITTPDVLAAASKTLAGEGLAVSAQALGGMVSSTVVPSTNLISVSATSHDPAAAAQIANAVAQAFVASQTASAQGQLGQAVTLLQQQAQQVQGELQAASAQLAKAQQQPGASAATTAQITADTSRLTSLSQQLDQTQSQLQAALAAEATLQTQLAAIPPTVQTTTAQSGGQPAGASGTGSGSSQSVTTAPNPLYQTVQSELQAQQVTVAQDRATVQQVGQEVAQVQSDLQALQSQATTAQAAIVADQAQVNNLQTTYNTLTAKVTETQIAEAVATSDSPASLGALAAPPTKPISPKKKLNVGLAFLLGLVAAVALALLLEQLDNTVKSTEEIERIAGLATLAVIPYARN